MKLTTEEVEFSFNNVLYRPIDEIAMESPLGLHWLISSWVI